MENLRRVLSCIMIAASLGGAALGFDTGPHFDLTRSVLTERAFSDDAIKIVQLENWLTDYYSTSPTIDVSRREVFAKLHCDNLFSTRDVANYWAWLINNIRRETQNAARKNDPLTALTVLGAGLHTVQDFYAHSNWVETHPRFPDGAYRIETYSPSMPTQLSLKASTIFTGKYPNDRSSGPGTDPIPPNTPIHGDYEKGVNKDSLIRPHWDEAYVFAYAASHELVEAVAKWADEANPGFWHRVQMYAADADGHKKLDYDITALRSMSMWLNGNGADGHWKGNKSGSSRFFSAFSLKWIPSASSVFVKQMKNGSVPDALSSNLYENIIPPPMPQMSKFSLRRTAVIVKTTLIKERADGGILQTAVSKIGAPDFYSRITIGQQEFWGRTMQGSRESADPWFEIYFSDSDDLVIPIKLSVWDEDNIDSAKDTPFDINQLTGKSTLDLVFSPASGLTSGDVSGKFDTPETAFTSSGEKPDKNRATIKAFVSRFPLR